MIVKIHNVTTLLKLQFHLRGVKNTKHKFKRAHQVTSCIHQSSGCRPVSMKRRKHQACLQMLLVQLRDRQTDSQPLLSVQKLLQRVCLAIYYCCGRR